MFDKKTVLLLSFIISCLPCFSQYADTLLLPPEHDSITRLPEVKIYGYPSPQPLMGSSLSAFMLDSAALADFNGNTLVPVLNTVPGVRMEQRSPGSYRLSVRGSLLRSPFGVRNVKIYFDDLPLTDAGGNTYLNALDIQSVNHIEVLKGPDGSIFGANSGGVVLLDTEDPSPISKIALGLQGGSYQSGMQYLSLKQNIGKHTFQFHQSYQTEGGYRENSALKRLYFQASDRWEYKKGSELNTTLLYSKLAYQTPGGLTMPEYEKHPEWAKQPTATIPGAGEQKAGVVNDLLFGGVTHKAEIKPYLRSVISIFGSYADFSNPFITNYETRKEKTGGSRFYFAFSGDEGKASLPWEYSIGFEGQVTNTDVHNYDNEEGEKGGLQATDEINSHQFFIFNHLKLKLLERLSLEGSVSINFSGYRFVKNNHLKKDFKPQLMPRVAMNWQQTENIAFRALLSRGFSAPTTAEIRPSDNQVYMFIEPEKGWNAEGGFRFRAMQNKLWIDVSGFYYRLQEAIVRRENDDGTEYFINSGGIVQPGLESFISYKIFNAPDAGAFLKNIRVSNSYTLSPFRFQEYTSGTQDYSGKALTGVARHIAVTGISANFATGAALSVFYNFTDKIPLNDANTVFSEAYHLLYAKVSGKVKWRNSGLTFFFAVDNILNQKYSLGNDLNAFGGRYFNAAPLRSFTTGLTVIMRYGKGVERD